MGKCRSPQRLWERRLYAMRTPGGGPWSRGGPGSSRSGERARERVGSRVCPFVSWARAKCSRRAPDRRRHESRSCGARSTHRRCLAQGRKCMCWSCAHVGRGGRGAGNTSCVRGPLRVWGVYRVHAGRGTVAIKHHASCARPSFAPPIYCMPPRAPAWCVYVMCACLPPRRRPQRKLKTRRRRSGTPAGSRVR